MASIRKDIRNRLAILLRTITTANGYNNTVQRVSNRVRMPDDPSISYPEIDIMIGRQEKSMKSDDGLVYEVRAGFTLIGHVRVNQSTSDTGGTLSDACDALIEDIEECLIDDETIFANTDAQLIIIDSDEAIYDDNDTVGMVIVNIIVVYFHDQDV